MAVVARSPRRSRPKPKERGAALFIVVLTLSLLTAIGVYAMHVTSLGQVASGYARRAGAVMYLTEFALNTMASEISANFDAVDTEGRSGLNTCRANSPYLKLVPGSTVFCYARDGAGLKAQVVKTSTYIGSDPEGFYGAMNRPDHPADQDIQANFRVELTDRVQGLPVAGNQIGGQLQTLRAMATVTAGHLPGGSAVCSADATRASDNQAARGYVVYTTSNTK